MSISQHGPQPWQIGTLPAWLAPGQESSLESVISELRGGRLLAGYGEPAADLGAAGASYLDLLTLKLHGPKVDNGTWPASSSATLLLPPATGSTGQILERTGPGAGEFAWRNKPKISHTHVQVLPQPVWSITHNLGYRPSVTLEDEFGDPYRAGIDHIDDNSLNVIHVAPSQGTAYCS